MTNYKKAPVSYELAEASKSIQHPNYKLGGFKSEVQHHDLNE